MRIGVDIRGLITGQRSGIEQYTLKVLERLVEHDSVNTYVLFYVAYRDWDSRLRDFLVEAPWAKNANVEIKKLQWINAPLLLHALWKPLDWPKVDKICGGLDVMWQPSPRLLPVSKKCRTVITFHDLVFELFPEFYPLASRLWQWQMSYPYLARTANRIIAVSRSTKQDLMQIYKIDPDKITVIYEGVDSIYFEPIDEKLLVALKQKFQVPGDYLYYLGSLEPRKNVTAIIRGLSYLKSKGFVNIKVVVSGGKGWLNEAIFAEVEKLGLKSEVVFTGAVTEDEKNAWLKGAKCFVFPSLYEGFGLPVLEAMAASCPVITSKVSSLPEVVGDTALLINPEQQTELNMALIQLLSDTSLATELAKRGRERARQFTWEAAAAQTLKVILNGVYPVRNKSVKLDNKQNL